VTSRNVSHYAQRDVFVIVCFCTKNTTYIASSLFRSRIGEMSVIRRWRSIFSAMLGHTVLGRQWSRRDVDFFIPQQRMFDYKESVVTQCFQIYILRFYGWLVRAVYTPRIYGWTFWHPYIRAVNTGVRNAPVRPYVRAVCTGSAYRPYSWKELLFCTGRIYGPYIRVNGTHYT